MTDLTIVLPTIRTHLLKDWYDSAEAACKDIKWDLVVTSPFFEATKEALKGKPNITFGHSYANPSVATQQALLTAKGMLTFLTTDDGYFMDDCLYAAVNAWWSIKDPDERIKAIVNMRYREGENYGGGPMPDAYWYPWSHPPLQLPGVKRSWHIAPQFMMMTFNLINLGGIDCIFEYSNYGIHDMTFRAQARGSKIYQSPKEVLCANHFPDDTVDHKPIYEAQTFYDLPIFQAMYNDPEAAYKRQVHPLNYQQYDKVWIRRFDPDNLPKTYKEMMAQKNGKHKV